MSRRAEFVAAMRVSLADGEALVREACDAGWEEFAAGAAAQVTFLRRLVIRAEGMTDAEWDAEHPSRPWWRRRLAALLRGGRT